MTITKEQLEKAAKAAGVVPTGAHALVNGHIASISIAGENGRSFSWCPTHDRGQLHDLAMACKICIDPVANVIAYICAENEFAVEVDCQDFPKLAEAVILACCEQFDAKGGE